MADMNDLQAWANGKSGEEQETQQQGNLDTGDAEGEGEQDDITPADALKGACMEAREAADYLDRAIAKMDDPGDLQDKVEELRTLADELEEQAEKLAEESEGDEEDEEDETEDGGGE